MERFPNWLWATPDGRSPGLARRLLGLVAALLAVTLLDLLVFDGPNPTSYVIALVVYALVGFFFAGEARATEGGSSRFWQPPIRLSPGRARLLIGLSAAMLVLAALGLVLYDGLERAVSAILFLSIGLSNFAWGLGSRLPEGPRARALRMATLPLGVVMFLAMASWIALGVSGRL